MSKKLNIILIVIILGLVCYILYGKFFNKNNPDVKIIDTEVINNTNDNDQTEENKVVSEIEYYHYEETITPEEDNEEENFLVFKSLYLFGNGEFYYNYAEYGDSCDLWSMGKYEINNNIITLAETKHGDCDECFYTVNLKEHVFTIDGNTLVSSEGEKLTVSTSSSVPSVDNFKNCDKNIE